MQQFENLAPHVAEIARALNNKLDPGAIEDELRRYLEYGVPLAQAKRDIVRMHGGQLTAGSKKVADLVAEDKGVEIVGRILTVNPKEITVKGAQKTIYYGFFADDTGKVSYTSWKDHNLERGSNVRIKNAYVKKGFREGVELSLGDYTTVALVDTLGFEIKDDFAAGSGPTPSGEFGGRAPAQERKVRDLREGQGSVTITGRILDLREKAISTVNGQKTLVEGEIADETGRVPFSAWEPDKLPPEFKANAVVRVKNAYVKAFRGIPNVNLGQYTQIEILPAEEMPDKASLEQAKPFTLGELESTGGGQGVLVEGVILEVKKGSGLIFRCAQEGCNRVLQKMECRIHGKQKGQPDLRIKAVLDDGYGAATFFANRDATERILGKTLDECQALAREAMTVDVIQDDLTLKLTARRVAVTGNATSDEFGLQIIASGVDYVPPKDVATEAEKLLGQLAELTTTEVGQ
jgi:replication factor A1